MTAAPAPAPPAFAASTFAVALGVRRRTAPAPAPPASAASTFAVALGMRSRT
jgi:hypothetical protein